MTEGFVAWTSCQKSLSARVNNKKVNMEKSLVLAAVSVCLLAALSAHAQNLVLNPGFETGSLAPWQAGSDTPTVVTGNAHTGTNALQMGQTGLYSELHQTLTLSAAAYVVDFWADQTGINIGSYHTKGWLSVFLDGVQVAYFQPSVGTAYTEYTATVTPTAGSSDLSFQWSPGGGVNLLDLDDVSVTQIPEPTTMTMTMIGGALLLLPFGASRLRMLRKTRTA